MDALSRLAGRGRPAPSPTVRPTVGDDFDDFLTMFDDLRGLVPASFFLLFRIARIIKSPDAKLGGQLKGYFDICEQSDRRGQVETTQKNSLADSVPVLTSHEPHIGTRRIKGIEELASVRPGDVATEDFTDLMRKAEERQLDVRVLLHEGQGTGGWDTAPIRDRGSRQMTNAAEQKLYILLDRSFSMWNHHRMLYAKVLAIEYLRQKKKTGARLFFRAFDFEVYELHALREARDYDRLIRELLYVEPGGKGTDITLAVETAARDISFDGMFEGAEIMLITDGMDRIETEHYHEILGDKIKLHMLKIGRDTADPQAAEIKELIEKDQSVAGLSRDEVTRLFHHRIESQWQEVTATLLETDDVDTKEIRFGEEEVDFACATAEKLGARDVREMSIAEAENAFRQASFVEGFIDVLLDNLENSPAVAAAKDRLKNAARGLQDLKIRIAAASGINSSLLAGKDLRFINDGVLRKQMKKAKLTVEDLARLQESQDLLLKLKLGGRREPGAGGDGLSMWQLLKLIMKGARRGIKDWLFGGEEAAEGETPAENQPEEKKTDSGA